MILSISVKVSQAFRFGTESKQIDMKVCIYDAPSAKEECIFHSYVDCLDGNAFDIVKKSMCQFTSCPSGCICEKDGEFNFGL